MFRGCCMNRCNYGEQLVFHMHILLYFVNASVCLPCGEC